MLAARLETSSCAYSTQDCSSPRSWACNAPSSLLGSSRLCSYEVCCPSTPMRHHYAPEPWCLPMLPLEAQGASMCNRTHTGMNRLICPTCPTPSVLYSPESLWYLWSLASWWSPVGLSMPRGGSSWPQKHCCFSWPHWRLQPLAKSLSLMATWAQRVFGAHYKLWLDKVWAGSEWVQ